ncbi:unnamed protein product [Linum tenue]|uniref:Uncharacterized protein n=1 Tax=Linum tenue TaxID=586396 RepID=A0AAV0NX18_9ROSI|nr:unnamed protein product [Linum tenue]
MVQKIQTGCDPVKTRQILVVGFAGMVSRLETTNPPPSITSSRPSSTFLGDNNGGLSSDYPPHLLGEDDGLLPFPTTTMKNLSRNDKDEETVSCGSNREETCKLCF